MIDCAEKMTGNLVILMRNPIFKKKSEFQFILVFSLHFVYFLLEASMVAIMFSLVLTRNNVSIVQVKREKFVC